VISCFRLSSGAYPADGGAGAALYGGRWNPGGAEAIYAAASISLATLEILAHFEELPRGFVVTEIRIPASARTQQIRASDLPPGWDSLIPSPLTQLVGSKWLADAVFPVLCIPSAIIPAENIYVINPKHPDFKRITFLPSQPFRFDPRLK
jgi:RES domain-containing protein